MTKLVAWVRRYWPELLTFAALATAIGICLSVNLTWMMVDSDGPEYVMDAKYLYPAHHTSAPLYLLTGHVFLMLPFGTDYWKMSLMSGVFTLGTCFFLYLIIRHFIQGNKGRWYGLLAALIFGGSMLAFAQAIVVETYAVVTFFSVGAYYFSLKKKWYLVAAFLGMGLVTHHLILLTWIVLFIAHKELRFSRYRVFGKSVPFFSKYVLIGAAFLLFYLYMPLSVRFTDQPNMWGNTGLKDFFTNNIGVFTMLVGQLSIYDFPKRVLDTLGVLGVSFAVASIPLIWWLWKNHKLRTELMWLFLLPIAYQVADLAPQVMKYQEASIAWGAIMAVLALSQMGGVRRFFNKKVLIGATAVGAVAMLGVNTYVLDIGNHLDPNLSATEFYQEELPKMQDGDIFVTNGAWEWILVFLYNKEEGHSIIPVCMGILPSERYRNLLRERGVVIDEIPLGLEGTRSHNLNEQQVYYSLNIVDKNQNVWTSRSTDPSTYGAEVVVADTNRDQFLKWLGHDIVRPAWHWKPTNPYFVVGGQVETTEWIFILQSNRTVIWLATLVGLGWIAGWAVSQLRRRSGKAKKG